MGAKMQNKSKSRRLILIILLIILIAAIIAGLYFWQMDRLRKARLEATFRLAVSICSPHWEQRVSCF